MIASEMCRIEPLVDYYNKTKDESARNELFTICADKIKEAEGNYTKNSEFINQYPYVFCDKLKPYTGLSARVLYDDTEIVLYFEDNLFKFIRFPSKLSKYGYIDSMLIADNLSCRALLEYERQTFDPRFIHPSWKLPPFYLYFSPANFDIFLQTEISRLFEIPRIVYISGLGNLEAFFHSEQVTLPITVQGVENGSPEAIALSKAAYDYHAKVNKNKEELFSYYKQNSQAIIENIKSGKPRVMLIYDEWGTITRYRFRAIHEKLAEMGCEVVSFISRGVIYSKRGDIWNQLNKLKPDIIFAANELRTNNLFLGIPDEIVFVALHFDPAPMFEDESTPSKMKERDFVSTLFKSEKKVDSLPYDKKKFILNPVTVNEKKYKDYTVSEHDQEKYSADIALVSAREPFEDALKTLIVLWEAKQELKFEPKDLFFAEEFCKNYRIVLRRRGNILTLREWRELIRDFPEQTRTEVSLKAQNFLSDFDNALYIQSEACVTAGLDVLIEKGYKNIKLYGGRFLKEEKYKGFAMGLIQNGDEMGKALKCSKIQFNNNPFVSFIDRTIETMINGALYLSNRICCDDWISLDIANVVEDKGCFVYFDDFDDLAEKVGYYLEHEDERKAIAERGRQEVINNHTTVNYINRIFEHMSNYFE